MQLPVSSVQGTFKACAHHTTFLISPKCLVFPPLVETRYAFPKPNLRTFEGASMRCRTVHHGNERRGGASWRARATTLRPPWPPRAAGGNCRPCPTALRQRQWQEGEDPGGGGGEPTEPPHSFTMADLRLHGVSLNFVPTPCPHRSPCRISCSRFHPFLARSIAQPHTFSLQLLL